MKHEYHEGPKAGENFEGCLPDPQSGEPEKADPQAQQSLGDVFAPRLSHGV
jgi:hypothetical protein